MMMRRILGLVLGLLLGAVNLYYLLQIVDRDIAGLRLDYTFPVNVALELVPTILASAFIAAVYPNFWFSDAIIMSETLVLLMAALTLLAAYRFWERPGSGRAVVLGVVCGLTALTRSEAVLLLPLLVLPVVAFLREVAPEQR